VAGAFLYFGGIRPVPVVPNPTVAAPTSVSAASTDVPALPAETPAVTETPSVALPPEVKGMALGKQDDGTIKFTDFDGGYEVTFPAGWLVVRPGNEDEFNAALANEGAKNAMLADQMNTDKSGYDAEFDRVYSYPLRPDIQKNVIFGFSKTAFDPSDEVPINNNTMGDWVHKFEATNIIPNLRVTASNLVENGNKITFMVVKGRFSLKNDNSDMVPFVAVVWFFKPTPKSLVSLTFTVLQDYQDQILPDLDVIRESIKVLRQ
jgi:hypothetical protein